MRQRRFSIAAHWRILLALVHHRPTKAIAVMWWWLTRRRVRAFDRLSIAMTDHPRLYWHWLSLHQPPRLGQRRLAALLGESAHLPAIAVHLHLHDQDPGDAPVASILSQVHCRWKLYITTDRPGHSLPADQRIHVVNEYCATQADGLARVLDIAHESQIVPLSYNARLTDGALLAFARQFVPEAVLYADQDEEGPDGRSNPWLKPEWDEDLFLAQDYLSDACAIPVEKARAVGIDPAWPDDIVVYALLARLLLGPSPPPVSHVPYVAVTTPAKHWHRNRPARTALVSSIAGLPAQRGPFGTVTLLRSLPPCPPKVSIIIPTRDRVDLLRTCVSGVLRGTDYPIIELIIVDNQSEDQETFEYFAELQSDARVKIVRWPYAYNYSAINNFAATQASGSYLCLLNNDTETIDAAWLTRMTAFAIRPEAGAVGARLLYPDRTIQHAGVVVGLGNAAGHAHRGIDEDAAGYFAQTQVARVATAVTAACLVIAKQKFEAVGGMDEIGLGVAYNDVDFCLKLRVAGWRNFYVPQAVMIHHESKSRGADFAPEHRQRYERELSVLQKRWNTKEFRDPVHHPDLDSTSETYRLQL